ncbi:aminoglycoside phosphotransferase family protein [Pedobacter yulinensis]|nr:aminoglycoside phosphotransferase family protein [Pedobacter yulinensis]
MRFDAQTLAGARHLLQTYTERWGLLPDGNPIQTHVCLLQPVRYGLKKAMLKVSIEEEEVRGGKLMSVWKGRGMASVYEQDGAAVLMEWGERQKELDRMAYAGQDTEANLVMCSVLEKIHAATPQAGSGFTLLDQWFRELRTAALQHGGTLQACLELAEIRLADQREITCLHGDIHHDNVLWFPDSGWKAIDPKCLTGERYFDYANLLTNPEGCLPRLPGRLEKQLEVICNAGRLDRRRMLEWTAAWSGLSAAWFINGDEDGSHELEVAAEALRLLGYNF